MVSLNLFVGAGAILLVFALYKFLCYCNDRLSSPLRLLPGPPSRNFIFGHLKEIWKDGGSSQYEKWVDEYGPTLRYKGLFNTDRLFTMDTKAINHVLMNSMDYQKPEPTRYGLSRILGNGLLVVEGEKHRLQRKIMNPAFGPIQIRELTGIFFDKANQLRDIWSSKLAQNGDEPMRINVLTWFSKAAFDIIGLAGFNYHFDSLNVDDKPNELNQAFSTIFGARRKLELLPVLQAYFPVVRILPISERDKISLRAKETMARIGHQLVQAAVSACTIENGYVDKVDMGRRDLLSLLIRSNMATDLPESQRLSEEDVIAQIPTFLVAGHETTSATTWALFALAKDITVQTKLRNELLLVSTDNPTMEELNGLPYLDAVVRETMRVHSPVPGTIRIAMKDDVLPLNAPFVDKKGVLRNSIRIKKGEIVAIPIIVMNRSKAIWGEDAREFKPERWDAVPEAASSIPGVWSKLMTFLGGPRACIGYRFSITEMKALLFALVRAFEFELGVPAEDIKTGIGLVQRPVVASDPAGGNQMPLVVKPYKGY